MEYQSTSDVSFDGYTLILPSVSVGNVGQLSCDLLISSMKLHKVGHFWNKCVLPIIGSDPFSVEQKNSLTVATEVFAGKGLNVAIMQQRAPIVAGMQKEYIDHLISWINEMKFREVVMLSSCHAYERKDEEITGSPMRYLMFPANEIIKEVLQDSCHLKELQKRKFDDGNEMYFMPGGGIAKSFFDECTSSSINFTTAILMMFCAEGDNIPEAIALANVLNLWKKYLPQNTDAQPSAGWIFPISWRHLFGNRQPSSIF